MSNHREFSSARNDEGGSGGNLNAKKCQNPVTSPLKHSNAHFYRPNVLPVAQPTMIKH